jgi:hypothetical protein
MAYFSSLQYEQQPTTHGLYFPTIAPTLAAIILGEFVV